MKIAPLLFCLLAAAAPARAAWTDIAASDFEVAPPPAPGSTQDKQDMATLMSDQQTRTPQQCALATQMKVPDFSSLFGPSNILSADEMARVKPFVDQVGQAASNISGVFKKKYARPRPYNENPALQPCADKPGGNTAYPSTHATEGAVDACVLSLIFPDRADKLTAWGQEVGDLRVISGVHHPTDVAAGQKLGADICSWLKDQGDFNAAVAQLRSGN